MYEVDNFIPILVAPHQLLAPRMAKDAVGFMPCFSATRLRNTHSSCPIRPSADSAKGEKLHVMLLLLQCQGGGSILGPECTFSFILYPLLIAQHPLNIGCVIGSLHMVSVVSATILY